MLQRFAVAYLLTGLCALCQPAPTIRVASTERRAGAEIRDIAFDGVDGAATSAFLIAPLTGDHLAGVLYIHWYDPAEPRSNRLEFLSEAVELAHCGQVSLLVQTPWSDPAWYNNRVQPSDYDDSVKAVKNVRRALDVLLADPRVDRDRLALVGHDFGALYGALAAAADPRIKALALMSPPAKASDWFMYGKYKLDGEARDRYVARMAPFDTTAAVASVKVPVLIQFADSDFYIPRESKVAFRTAEPDRAKLKILLYDGGHGLGGDDDDRDRRAFLMRTIHLRQDPIDIVHDYLDARNDWDSARIESFLAPDYRETDLRGPSTYAFEKAAKAHYEYRVFATTPDSVTVDLTESSDYTEALGSGVSGARITYRFIGAKIREAKMTSRFDARLPYEAQSKKFGEWIVREHSEDAPKVIQEARVRMTGDSAGLVLQLAKAWESQGRK